MKKLVKLSLLILFPTFLLSACSFDMKRNEGGEDVINDSNDDDNDNGKVTPIEADDVSLNLNTARLKVDETFQLIATVTPKSAADKEVTWSTSDSSIVSVVDGLITGLKEGSAIVTVTHKKNSSLTDTCAVTVYEEGEKEDPVISVTGVSVSPSTLNLKVGESSTLTATVSPNNASNPYVSWSSGSEDIATVNKNGVVNALRAGSSIITATTQDGSFTSSCLVTVTSDTTGSDNNLVGNKYLIDAYGDYMEYVDSSKDPKGLVSEFETLSTQQIYSTSDVLEAKYQIGLYEFFNIENEVNITINISNDELQKMNNDHNNDNTESYRICSLDITFKGLHFHYEEVGIRQKGNLSRGAILDGSNINLRHYKLSFEETFDDEFTESPKKWSSEVDRTNRENRKFFGENKIDIRWNRNEDGTYLKEYYAYEMQRANGGLAPRSNPVSIKMNIDGDNQNLGVYLMVETVNKSFIHRNVKKDARNGDLYKISWGSGEAGTFNNTDNRLFGIESQTKNGNGTFGHKNYTYDLKTNKTTSNHSTFKAFISTIADSNFHGGDSYAFMQSNSVYDEFISYAAGAYLCGDPDDLRGNGNNTYVYFANVNGTSQIVFIPTDNDRSFGSDGGGQNPTGSHGAKVSPFADTTGYYGYSNICNLFAKTVVSSNSKDIRLDYLKKIKSIINNGWLESSTFSSYYNKMASHYSDDLALGSRINYHTIGMTMDESNDVSGGSNVSIATYLSTIKNTFNTFVSDNNYSL